MKKNPDFRESYKKQTSHLLGTQKHATAMSNAVGGNFEAAGKLEFALLKNLGLKSTDTVLDVGCGSGRLAAQLKEYLSGKYIGIDVVPELIQYAEQLCNRNDWKFYEAPGLTIPEKDSSMDFICFFSVITHLLHEESYKYLEEATRVAKSGGLIVVSFLDFAVPSHWTVFQQVLGDDRPDKVLNQFCGKDALCVWAQHLGLEMMEMYAGDKPHIQLEEPIVWEDGRRMEGSGNLGQSICVLKKP